MTLVWFFVRRLLHRFVGRIGRLNAVLWACLPGLFALQLSIINYFADFLFLFVFFLVHCCHSFVVFFQTAVQ